MCAAFRLTRQQNTPMFSSRVKLGKVFSDFHAWTRSLITLTFLFVPVQISNICMKISKFWH